MSTGCSARWWTRAWWSPSRPGTRCATGCWRPHYLSVAETAAPHLHGPGQGSWYTRLDADQANLRHAAEHAAGRPDGTAQVLRFAVALWWYWDPGSGNEEAAGLVIPVLRRPEAAADPALFAEALIAAAGFIYLADLPTGLQLAKEAAEVASRLGDDRLLILSRVTLSLAYYSAGEPDRARPLGAEAVQRARQVGDDVLLGYSLGTYALCTGAAASAQLYAEAFACTERSGDLGTKGALHTNAGLAAFEMGDIPGARTHLEAAIQIAEALGRPHPLESGNLGDLLLAEHDLGGARSTYEDVVRIARRTGDKNHLASAIDGLARLATDLKDWPRAAMLHGAAQALHDTTGAPWEPPAARRRQESLDQAGGALGGKQLQRAYTDGMALSFDQAIDLALAGVPPAT